jgi:hypothetical protein
MRRKLSVSWTPLLAALALLTFAATHSPAMASPATKSAGAETAATAPQDVSSARKHRRGKVYVERRVYAYPPYMMGPYDAAPSFGFIGGPDGYPGEYAWRKSLGQCVLDLGYGRWKGC